MKTKYLLYAFLPIIAVTLIAGTTYAATSKTAKNNYLSTIAAAIAKKFNLNTTDVQSVINETMATERAAITKSHPAQVDPIVQAVTAGKLTQVQADLIVAKKTEIKALMDSLKNATPAEKATALKTQTASLKQWATTNNIPQQYIMFLGARGQGRGGMLGFKGLEFNKTKLPTTTTQTPTN